MDKPLAERMTIVAFDRLRDAQNWLDENRVESFDQRGTQENDVRCMVVSDVPQVEKWWNSIPPPSQWAVFKHSEWLNKPLRGVFIRIDFPNHGKPLLCFTNWTGTLLFRRKGLLAALSESRYSLRSLEGEIYLPEGVHFYLYDGIVIAPDWKQFENAVSYKELTIAAALTLWTKFNKSLPIRAAGDVWKILSKSLRHQNTILKTFGKTGKIPTVDRIVTFISEQKLPISCVDGEILIDAKDKVQIEILITIIADGFVTSDLTDTKLKTLDAEPR